MSPSTTPRVLIVGAGPSGLVCALSLLRNGVPVRLIEKSTEPRLGQRGAGIMPRSLELFNAFGFADQVVKLAIPPPPTLQYQLPKGTHPINEFEMSPNAPPTPSCPFTNIVLLGQSHLEDILRASLAELGCTVEAGTELVAFEQVEGAVNVQLARHGKDGTDVEGTKENASYDWMIGSDGARGVVRKLSGFSFLGETRTIETHVVGDIFVEGLSQKYWHMWGDASTLLVSLRPTETHGLFSFIVAGPEINHSYLSNNEAALRKCFEENTGSKTGLKFGAIPWVNHYTPNIRMVQTFQKGRVFLVGDSAHVHSFSGGQGMNTGIQDAYNLSWKLALVQRKYAHPSLLHSYSDERIPVIREMLSRTTKILKRSFTEKTPDAWGSSSSGSFSSSSSASDGAGGGMLQLGINYRWSPIVLDERKRAEDAEFADFDFDEGEDEEPIAPIDAYGGHGDAVLRAGDRAPDASDLVDLSAAAAAIPKLRGLGLRRLFGVFGPSYHTVLVFAPAHHQCPAIVRLLRRCPPDTVRAVVIVVRGQNVPPYCREGVSAVLEDKLGHAHAGYGILDGWGVVVVRPDGVVGAILAGAEGVQRYFGGIFGRRRA
ncbi:hypothetical protein DXG03_009368 [Asterophora parasitica]|uniref:FAD-binding domain-containing protein n=1 Tax=Asterophora parasitica TaxID=117018 RepID=A0A9P7GCB2_9AGAR|nr:hypothetical protein DXG03_009368 [Asterophora parasitica]